MSTMTKLDLYVDEYSTKSAKAPYGISAGGVVYRKTAGSYEFLLLGRNDNNGISYHLPKGTLHLDETIENCATREIREEAGVEVHLTTYLGGKHATFDFKGKPNDKIFHYYAAEFIGEATPMDNEHDFREWCQYDDAIVKLRPNTKREDIFIERAKKYLGSNNE